MKKFFLFYPSLLFGSFEQGQSMIKKNTPPNNDTELSAQSLQSYEKRQKFLEELYAEASKAAKEQYSLSSSFSSDDEEYGGVFSKLKKDFDPEEAKNNRDIEDLTKGDLDKEDFGQDLKKLEELEKPCGEEEVDKSYICEEFTKEKMSHKRNDSYFKNPSPKNNFSSTYSKRQVFLESIGEVSEQSFCEQQKKNFPGNSQESPWTLKKKDHDVIKAAESLEIQEKYQDIHLNPHDYNEQKNQRENFKKNLQEKLRLNLNFQGDHNEHKKNNKKKNKEKKIYNREKFFDAMCFPPLPLTPKITHEKTLEDNSLKEKNKEEKNFTHLFDHKMVFSPTMNFLSSAQLWHEVDYEEKSVRLSQEQKKHHHQPSPQEGRFSHLNMQCDKKKFSEKNVCFVKNIQDIFTNLCDEKRRFYIDWEEKSLYVTRMKYESDEGEVERLKSFFVYCSPGSESLMIPRISREEILLYILKFPNYSLLHHFLFSSSLYGHILIDDKKKLDLGYEYYVMFKRKKKFIRCLLAMAEGAIESWILNKDENNLAHFFYLGLINENYTMFPSEEGLRWKKHDYHLEEKKGLALACFRQLLKHEDFRHFFLQPMDNILSFITTEYGQNTGFYKEVEKLIIKNQKNEKPLSRIFNKISTALTSFDTFKKSNSYSLSLNYEEGALLNILIKYILYSNLSINKVYNFMRRIEKKYYIKVGHKYGYKSTQRESIVLKFVAEEDDIGTKERNEKERKIEQDWLEFIKNKKLYQSFQEYKNHKKKELKRKKMQESVLLVSLEKSSKEKKENIENRSFLEKGFTIV